MSVCDYKLRVLKLSGGSGSQLEGEWKERRDSTTCSGLYL